MRDKYIELIKEYVRQKPEYKDALNELKDEVLNVGATEEEFDEAVKQITNIQYHSPQVASSNKQSTDYILANTKQPTGKSPFKIFSARSATLAQTTTSSLKNRKKVLALVAIGLILLVSLTQLFGTTTKKSNNAELAQDAPKVDIQEITAKAIPVVYANTKTVDPERIFSIKSTNVKLTVTGRPKKEVLGFFPYWMLPKEDQINLTTLTSISLFGLDVNKDGNITTQGENKEAASGWSMWNDPKLDSFIKKAQARDLKVYITFKSFDSLTIESITKSDTAQKNFIANAIFLANSKNLDGVNIDFEYVGSPSEAARDGFTRLITNLSIELKRQIPGSTLTIDTYLVSGSDKGLFNIPLLSEHTDAFVIMGYDMHTPNGSSGPVSAMGGPTNIVGYVQNYLEKTAASKLILAVPYYGYDWPKNSDLQTSSENVKTLPYAEIAEVSKNLQLSWDDTSQTPFYTYKENGLDRIVHFDNVRSLGVKYDFINQKGLRGVGIWALGYDGQNQDLEKLLIDKFINL